MQIRSDGGTVWV
jgi:hypothetical protein